MTDEKRPLVDTVALSRSNAKSRNLGTSSDFAPQTEGDIATGQLPNRYFCSGHATICYRGVYEIALFLWALPEHIPAYVESMYSLANVCAAWGDFKGARENLNFLTDVRIRIAELNGRKHNGEISEANR